MSHITIITPLSDRYDHRTMPQGVPRTDPTGRSNPLIQRKEYSGWWEFLTGVAIGLMLVGTYVVARLT